MAKSDNQRPLRKGAKSAFIKDRENVTTDGKVQIIRTVASGEYWSVAFYVPAEQRIHRKSLRVKNKDEAKQLALREYMAVEARVEAGESISSITAKELVSKFLAEEDKRVAEGGRHDGGISRGRHNSTRTVLTRHFLDFVGPQTRLDAIAPSKFLDYYHYRRKKASDVRKATLKNERSHISGLFRFAKKAKLIGPLFEPEFPKIPGNTQKYMSKDEARDAFSVSEFQTLCNYLASWDERANDDQDKYERRVVRDFMLIAASTGLRPGEMKKLKWSMIELTGRGDKMTVKINVPKDTKTGARPVQAPHGMLFKRIQAYSEHTNPTDFVFADRGIETAPFPRRTLYRLWALMMKETGIDQLGKNLAYYSLRHTYCTFRLMEGTDVYLLARNMGTSVEYIQEHYAHVEIDQMRDELTKAVGKTKSRETVKEGDLIGMLFEKHLRRSTEIPKVSLDLTNQTAMQVKPGRFKLA